jgi:hypothetical protein
MSAAPGRSAVFCAVRNDSQRAARVYREHHLRARAQHAPYLRYNALRFPLPPKKIIAKSSNPTLESNRESRLVDARNDAEAFSHHLQKM